MMGNALQHSITASLHHSKKLRCVMWMILCHFAGWALPQPCQHWPGLQPGVSHAIISNHHVLGCRLPCPCLVRHVHMQWHQRYLPERIRMRMQSHDKAQCTSHLSPQLPNLSTFMTVLAFLHDSNQSSMDMSCKRHQSHVRQ